MGFRKPKNLASAEIRIPIEVKILDYETSMPTGTSFTVHHVLRMPTLQEEEEYSRRQLRVRGKKVDTAQRAANWYLWQKVVIRVEGYDDLPKEGDWRLYFKDDAVGMAHVTAAIDQLFDMISADQGELEKKFEPSLEL